MSAKQKNTFRRRAARHDVYESVFAALAHPARRHVLMTLNFQGGTMQSGELAALFEHAWPTTTRHLRVLESAGLLDQEKRGRTRIYRINQRQLGLVRDWIAWFFKSPG